jgi:DNA-binding CsgD family transcriptional regulator
MASGSGSAAPATEAGGPPEGAALRALRGRNVWVGSAAARTRSRTSRLSGKELTVLGELARGSSTEEIAERMYVSPHTVRTHVKNGMRKLEARTRAHAVAIALSEGAITMAAEGEGEPEAPPDG